MARVIVDDQLNYPEAVVAPQTSPGGGLWILVATLLILMFLFNSSPWTTNAVDPVVGSSPEAFVRSSPEIRYVVANELNLREGPSNSAWATYILPRNTAVILLGETSQEFDGDVWVKIGIETINGRVIGWVNRRYIA